MGLRSFLERKAVNAAEKYMSNKSNRFSRFLKDSRSINYEETLMAGLVGESQFLLNAVRNGVAAIKKRHVGNVVERASSHDELKGMDQASLEGALKTAWDVKYKKSKYKDQVDPEFNTKIATALHALHGNNHHRTKRFLSDNHWGKKEAYGIETDEVKRFFQIGKSDNIFDNYVEIATANSLLSYLNPNQTSAEVEATVKSYALSGNMSGLFENLNHNDFIKVMDFYHHTDDANTRFALEKMIKVAKKSAISSDVTSYTHRTVDKLLDEKRQLAQAVVGEPITQTEYRQVMSSGDLANKLKISGDQDTLYMSPERAKSEFDGLYDFLLHEARKWGNDTIQQNIEDYMGEFGSGRPSKSSSELNEALMEFVERQSPNIRSEMLDSMRAYLTSKDIVQSRGEEGGSVYGILMRNVAGGDKKQWESSVLESGVAETIESAVMGVRHENYKEQSKTTWGGILAYAKHIGVSGKNLGWLMEKCMAELYNDFLMDTIDSKEFETSTRRMFEEAGKRKGDYDFNNMTSKTMRLQHDSYVQQAKKKVRSRNYESHFAYNDAVNYELRTLNNKMMVAEKAFGLDLARPARAEPTTPESSFMNTMAEIEMERARAKNFKPGSKGHYNSMVKIDALQRAAHQPPSRMVA